MKAYTFKAEVNTPLGRFIVAVKSPDFTEAGHDARSAVMSELHCCAGNIRVCRVWRDEDIRDFAPLPKCHGNGEQWAWIAR